MNKGKFITDFVWITLGMLICGVAIYCFLIPSGLSVGSVSGLAIVLSHIIPIPISVITLICNVVLLAVGYLFIGREFGAKTVYTSLLLPVVLRGLEQAFPHMHSLMDDPFLDMICYLFLAAVGQALIFMHNASSGGLDIVGKLLNKYLHIDLGRAIALAGMCVALSSVFFYDAKTVILSVLGTYLSGIILDHFIFGFDPKRRVCILSDRTEELRAFIINDLHSGATIYNALGAYVRTPREELVVIVNKQEYAALMEQVKKTDPSAFVTVYTVNDVTYRPKPKRRQD